MQSINRFLYGPTPEERIRALQGNLRGEQRRLDRDMREVCPSSPSEAARELELLCDAIKVLMMYFLVDVARYGDEEGEDASEATCEEWRCEECEDACKGGRAE